MGLKSDLRTKRTCIDLLKTQGLTPVTPEQGQAVAHSMGAIYIECSSKESRGVDEVFELAVNTAIKQEMGVRGADHCGGSQQQAAFGGGVGGRQRVKKRSCKIL